MQRISRIFCGRWTCGVIGMGGLLACVAMVITSLPGKSVVLRPEIDLLLEDIREEPTPDNIETLISKARTSRSSQNSWGMDGSLDENHLAPNEVAHVARYLREQYPFESLKQRLAYERNAERANYRLNNRAINWLHELESESATESFYQTSVSYAVERADALKKLHSDEVVAFINREGEGLSRMPTYGVEFVVLPDVPAIPLAVNATVQHSSSATPEVTLQRYRYDQNRGRTKRGAFFELHALYRNDFAATRNGWVVDVDQVAGFAPHAITRREDIRGDEPTESTTSTQTLTSTSNATSNEGEKTQPDPLWRVSNLLLMSLLKFDRPYVYVSEFMPAMTELPDLEKRDLTAFENKALQRLYSGEDIVSDTSDDKIKMLGSLRASKDCLSCHSADRGELLGAFSYELVRVGTQSDSQSENRLAF